MGLTAESVETRDGANVLVVDDDATTQENETPLRRPARPICCQALASVPG